jgi:anti-anti-sigma factor
MSNFRSTVAEHFETNSVKVGTADGVSVLTLRGEFDVAMAPIVRPRLGELEGDVEVDCAELTFMGAAGINLLVEIREICLARGAKLTVVNAPRCVTWLLALTQLDGVFDVRSRVADA